MRSEIEAYPRKAFLVCFTAYTFSQMDLALFGYAIPPIRAEFDLSLSGVIGIVSIAFLIAGILISVFGVMTDRYGRRRMFQFSIVTSSVLVALHAVVPNPAALTLLRGASIATGGLSYPITGAVISEEFPGRYRGFFVGILQIGYPLGWVLASFMAAWVLAQYNWRYLFLVGLLSLPFLLVVNRVIREPKRSIDARASGPRAHPRELFSPTLRKRTLLLFSAQFLFVWAYAGSIFLFPSFLTEVRGLGRAEYSQLIGYGHLIGAFGYLLAAFIGEFVWTRRNTVVVWTLTGAAAFQVMVWFTDSFAETLLAYGVMSMFFYGSAAVKFAYLAEVFPTRVRATAMALAGSLAVTLGSAAGPWCVARAVEIYGWTLGYSVLVGVPLVLAGLLYTQLTKVPSGLEVEAVQDFIDSKEKTCTATS